MWRPDIEDLLEELLQPDVMSVPPEMTLKDLCLKVAKRYNIPFEKLVFVKRLANNKL